MIPAFQTLLTLLVVSFLVYFLIGLMPGDPVDLMISGNPSMTAEDAARLRALHGLDRPLLLRYGQWLASALSGDLGYSRLYGLPVIDVLLPALGRTLLLSGIALIVTLLLAVPAGVYAAARKNAPFDRAINILCFIFLSLPSFWLGLLLISLFAVTLGWVPASASLQSPVSLILPVVTLSLGGFAVYARHSRQATGQALLSDYIRTAQAKGCDQKSILWRHAFRNSLLPLVTLLMLDMGALLGGALTVEVVFAFPGMGKILFDAVMGNDYNLALAGFLILTTFVLLASLAADILCKRLDPRGEKPA